VINGAYTVNLDFGAAVFTGADRFMEINYRPVGGVYTTLTPRKLVTSAPYSIRSQVATSAEGLSASCTNCVTSNQIQSVQGSQVSGGISGSQISGQIPLLSVPPGNNSYIQNTLNQQLANFNISGQGTVGGALSANAVNATTQYNLDGLRVLSWGALTDYNLFAGRLAGDSNTTGYRNAFVGSYAGNSNTTGNVNSFFGTGAGSYNTTGSFNSFFGAAAGNRNTAGNSNAFFGANAGYSNTTGGSNSFFGGSAGNANTTGFSNVFVGSYTGSGNTTGSSNTFVGTVAGGSTTTGTSNAFFGASTGYGNTTGLRNTFIGAWADFSATNATGNDNTLLGYNTKVTSGVNNASAIGVGAQATASNTIVLGTSSETVIIRGKLQVDLLGTAGSQQVCLNGSNRLAPCSSSLRYKTDLQPFAGGLSIINRLEPISYTWKSGGLRDVGFGAEAVEKVEPLFITYNADGQVEGVKYDRITVALVNAIKEQQQQIAAQQQQLVELGPLQAENAKLKAQLTDILARLEQLEKLQAGQK
jgi:hypothetical protein